MRVFEVSALTITLLLTVVQARPQGPQQQIDPAYLRDYYSQIAQAGGRGPTEATPIYEQESPQNLQPQYLTTAGQQIRVKDSANEQIRAQQRLQGQQQQYQAPNVRQYLGQPQPQPQQALQFQPPVYQQQNIQYNRPQVAKQTGAIPRRPAAAQPQYESGSQSGQYNKEDEDADYENSPNYQFGFDVKDDEFTNYQNRKESRDGNVIKGSYSVVDSDGFIRTVTYTADPKEGFKAEVVREPTDIVVKIPTPSPEGLRQQHHQQQPQYVQQPTQYRAAPRQPQQIQQQQQQQQPQYQYEN